MHAGGREWQQEAGSCLCDTKSIWLATLIMFVVRETAPSPTLPFSHTGHNPSQLMGHMGSSHGGFLKGKMIFVPFHRSCIVLNPELENWLGSHPVH